ncbi:MAG: NADH-quinone oxidoreductase subunit NuoE [Chloroflexi bacterium]|nr:NADH-quinone oxidoreductase subunit NuoE [Chloroflexota bacterium]
MTEQNVETKEIKPVAAEIDLSKLDGMLGKYAGQQGSLIPALQEVQAIYGYLPEPVFDRLSEALNISLAKIYGVSTFYSQFYLEPRGKNIIRLCDGTACHVKGSGEITEAISTRLKVKPGETTPDGEVTFEVIYCLGSCGLAPVAVVNEKIRGRLTIDDTHKLLDDLE